MRSKIIIHTWALYSVVTIKCFSESAPKGMFCPLKHFRFLWTVYLRPVKFGHTKMNIIEKIDLKVLKLARDLRNATPHIMVS